MGEIELTKFKRRELLFRIEVDVVVVSDGKADIAAEVEHWTGDDVVRWKVFSEVLVVAGKERPLTVQRGMSSFCALETAFGAGKSNTTLQLVGEGDVQCVRSTEPFLDHFDVLPDDFSVEVSLAVVSKSLAVPNDPNGGGRRSQDLIALGDFWSGHPVVDRGVDVPLKVGRISASNKIQGFVDDRQDGFRGFVEIAPRSEMIGDQDQIRYRNAEIFDDVGNHFLRVFPLIEELLDLPTVGLERGSGVGRLESS